MPQPKIEKKEMRILSQNDIVALIEAATRVSPDIVNLLKFFILTGVRKNEALGLRWSDVDIPNRKINIRQQLLKDGVSPEFSRLKTDAGQRTLHLSETIMEALLDEQAKQAAYKSSGIGYNDYDLVFCQSNGRPLPHKPTYSKLHRCFREAFTDKDFGFHVFRHTNISLLLLEHTPVQVVSKMSGHRQTSTTMNTYAHVLSDSTVEAAKSLDASIFGDTNN